MEFMPNIINIKYSKKRNGYYVIYDYSGLGGRSIDSRFFSERAFCSYVEDLLFDAKKYREIVRLVAPDVQDFNLGDDNE